MRLAHVVVCVHPRLALGAADAHACVLFEAGMGERDQRHQDVCGRGGEVGAAAAIGLGGVGKQWRPAVSTLCNGGCRVREPLIVVEVVDAGPAQHTRCGQHPVFAGHDPQGVGHGCEVVGEVVVERLPTGGAGDRDAPVMFEDRNAGGAFVGVTLGISRRSGASAGAAAWPSSGPGLVRCPATFLAAAVQKAKTSGPGWWARRAGSSFPRPGTDVAEPVVTQVQGADCQG